MNNIFAGAVIKTVVVNAAIQGSSGVKYCILGD